MIDIPNPLAILELPVCGWKHLELVIAEGGLDDQFFALDVTRARVLLSDHSIFCIDDALIAGLDPL